MADKDILEVQVKQESFCQEVVDGEVITKPLDNKQTAPSSSSTEADNNSSDNSQPHGTLALSLEDLESPQNEDKHTEEVPIVNERKISGKKLLIFDLNGLLIHKVHSKDSINKVPKNRSPDAVLLNQKVYKRPFVDEFLNSCLERFEVAIWSSAVERSINGIMDQCFNKLKKMPLFIWDQKYCSDYGFRSLEKKGKPLFFKDLRKVWSCYFKSEKGPFTSKNTLLIDDSPCKALLNPANTGIFPATYDVHDPVDNALDPKGELATWLNGLFHAEDVPTYVAANPFGQPGIKEGHRDWPFYSNILCHPTLTAHLSTV